MNRKHTPEGNILLVANWESNVGYAWWLMENFWTTISGHFEQQGKHCYLIYPKITQIPESIATSDVRIEELNFRSQTRKNRSALRQLIKSNDIRYIYLSDSPSYSLFYIRLRLWGIKKIVVHEHSPGERTPPSSWRKSLKMAIQRMPWITADHFIAVTDFVYRRFIEVSCIPPGKCSIALNGIQPVDLESSDTEYAYRELDIPLTRQIVVTTGRASSYKGIEFFIECAAELVNKQELHQLHFLFCGDGPDIELFRTLVKRLDIGDHFTFAGQRTDVRQILPSCHIGFHAAAGEVGYSLSILEYMSAGLVTIVPDRPSTSLATRHMQTGLLYTPQDVRSATEAIKIALEPGVASRLRENAIFDVKDRFTIEKTNEQLIEILNPVFTCRTDSKQVTS